MPFCSRCGRYVEVQARFCPYCGSALATTQFYYQRPQPPQYPVVYRHERKGSSAGAIAAVLIVLVLVAVIVLHMVANISLTIMLVAFSIILLACVFIYAGFKYGGSKAYEPVRRFSVPPRRPIIYAPPPPIQMPLPPPTTRVVSMPTGIDDLVYRYIVDHSGAVSMNRMSSELGVPIADLSASIERLKASCKIE